MRKSRNPLLIAIPAFALGGIVTASLTTTARAQDPVPAKTFDYAVATQPAELGKYGKEGYEIVHITQPDSGWPIWTLQRR